MRSAKSKFIRKIVIISLSLVVITLVTGVVNKKANKSISEIAGVAIVNVTKFIGAALDSATAQTSNPYQNVGGNVGISGDITTSAGTTGNGDITLGATGNRDVSAGRLKLNNSYVHTWGNSIIDGRVWSSNANIHLSPANGSNVVINTDYRDAGGAAGTAGLTATGTITAPTFAGSLSGTATNANQLIGKNWYWSGQGGQPTWLWGGSDGTNMYVYNPSNFSVSNADTTDGWHLNQDVRAGANPTFQETYTNGWFRVNGGGGIYWSNYYIGWQVYDGTWLRTYNNASIIAANGQIGTNSMQMGGNRYGWPDKGCTGCADSINGNPNLWLTAQTQVYVRSPGWNAYDVAELYPMADNADSADLVSVTQTTNGFAMKKSSKAYDSNLAGVISENPAILFDGGGLIVGWKPDSYVGQDEQETKTLQALKEQHKGKKPVALAGRVPFNVSSINGEIKQGDPITSSDIPGVGMKATRAGQIIGKALENFDESKATPCSDNPQYQCSKITVFINVSWFDPDVYLTSTDGFHLDFGTLKDAAGNLVSRIGAFSEIIVGKIQAGIIETKQLIVNGVNILERLDTQQKEIDALKAEIEQLKK